MDSPTEGLITLQRGYKQSDLSLTNDGYGPILTEYAYTKVHKVNGHPIPAFHGERGLTTLAEYRNTFHEMNADKNQPLF